eukprot:4804_1
MSLVCQQSLKQHKSYWLINGYVRPLNIIIPNEIIILCLSFYYHLIKLVYCDDKSGEIDTRRYILKPCPENITFKHIVTEIEDSLNIKSKTNTSYIHIWLRFGQIKKIYPIDKPVTKLTEQELEIEDNNRWVELPYDYEKI